MPTRGAPVDELDQFLADALGGDDLDAVGHLGHGEPDVVVNRHAELGRKPGRAHHAQGIVGEGRFRGAGRGELGGVEVADAAERIHQFQAGQPSAPWR
jgi:hypothetical protein